ncbi:PH domain-containing protein [Phocaeicola sp.]
MEQVFKTKRTNGWWQCVWFALILAILLCCWVQVSFAFALITPVLLWYNQDKTTYTVKDNGVLKIKSFLGKGICVDGITKIVYNPRALGMQKIKIEHAQGFVMVNPEKPLEFVEALRKVYPALIVAGFEQINN